jgi:Domain of unknown function (DUF4192)
MYSDPQQTLVITTPADAIAAMPYLLGFHPADSLAIIGWSDHGTFALRVDLVAPEDHSALICQLLDLMVNNNADAVILLGYGPDERVTPLLKEAQDALEDILVVKAVLRVHQNRWWSLQCADPGCCPADGTPYDISTTPVAAKATFDGRVALASRADLEATLAPVEGQDWAWMLHATQLAEAELLHEGPGSSLLVEEGLRLVRSLIGRDEPLTDGEVARLTVACTNIRVRDEAWVRIKEHPLEQQLRLWRDVTRRAVGEYAAAPAALLAFTAYLNGDGGLVNIALDRAREALPTYYLTTLLQTSMNAGVPPRVLRERFDMTPAMLAEAHGEVVERM